MQLTLKFLKNKKLLSCAGFLSGFFARNVLTGIFLGAIIWFLPFFMERIRIKRRSRLFEGQLIDGLSLLSGSLRSGANLFQSIEFLVHESPAPISDEFGIVLKSNKLGVSLAKSLEEAGVRIKSDEFDMVITAIVVTQETGGNLAEVLEHLSKTMAERNRLKGRMNSLTAQGRMSGIVVGSLPVLLSIALFFIDPQLIYPMFHTVPGLLLAGLAAAMELTGMFLIRKIINVEI